MTMHIKGLLRCKMGPYFLNYGIHVISNILEQNNVKLLHTTSILSKKCCLCATIYTQRD